MNDKIKFYFDKARHSISGIEARRKKQIAILAFVLIAASVIAAVILNMKSYSVLFTGLNEQEATEIMSKLQAKNVSYKYEDGGTIMVDSKQEEQLKAELVYEGYPKSGFTYDIFKDNIDLMTTDFEKNNYKLFELQDRIGATIRLFDGVKDAKVTIALGEDRRYVLDANQKTQASASVVVIMESGGSPTPEQVRGIQRLVSKSIPQLEMNNVAVLDGEGNDVSMKDSLQSELTKLKADLEYQIESSVKAKVMNVLIPFYGEENVRVSVKATVDVNKRIRETINYSLPQMQTPQGESTTTGGEAEATGETQAADEAQTTQTQESETTTVQKGIPSRESINQEIVRDPATAGGVAGTESNADIPIYGALTTDGSETHIVNQNDIDYLVNQIKEQIQFDSGVVEDMTISVSLNTAQVQGVENADLLALIGNAAGIAKEDQESKITVVRGAFYDPNALTDELGLEVEQNFVDQYRIWIIGAGGALIFAIIVTLIVAILLRKRKKSKKGLQLEVARQHPILEVTENAQQSDLVSIKNEKTLELRNSIRDFATDNPEISAQLLRSWLRGEDDNE